MPWDVSETGYNCLGYVLEAGFNGFQSVRAKKAMLSEMVFLGS